MPVIAKKSAQKKFPIKRRRLSKQTFNMSIKSKVDLDEDILSGTIQNIFEEFLRVNLKLRPDDDLDDNIKSIEPYFHPVDSKTFQFKLDYSGYTVVEFAFSEFALKLSKLLRLPIGYLKIEKLRNDLILEQKEVKEEKEVKVRKKCDPHLFPTTPSLSATEVEEIKIEEPKEVPLILDDDKKMSDIIDKQIEFDQTVPLQIPPGYSCEIEETNMPIGKSSLPPMPALEEIKNTNPQSSNSDSYFNLQNLFLGLGGLFLGMKLSGGNAPVSSESYFPSQVNSPIYFD